ncbi:MAG: YdcF family protein [Prolixibacteraceae bacterium]|jgi:uncharacterized SAM-binding protein YcdF (DUF218 family)|nr:YdcF family protein [Prolixibacteraceae bacterium]
MPFLSLLRELIKSILTPLPLLWLLLIAACLFQWRGKKKMARFLLGFSLLWFFLISTPFLPYRLMISLENRYPPIQISGKTGERITSKDTMVHILVLGSGYQTDDRLSYSAQLNSAGLARLAEGIRLHRLHPGSKLIFSGYKGNQPLPQAVVISIAARELGVDSLFTATITEPWNTKSEAAEYFKRFGTSYKIYLVTDASHMPRAVRHFRNAGLNPIPSPANFNIRKNSLSGSYLKYFPSSDNIRFMEIVFQEYLGMLWAKMGGN